LRAVLNRNSYSLFLHFSFACGCRKVKSGKNLRAKLLAIKILNAQNNWCNWFIMAFI
jgi:hypothetical protein